MITLADVLRAESAGQDLQEGDDGIHVCAMLEDGTLYEIGMVSDTMIYQDPRAAWKAISRIKFRLDRVHQNCTNHPEKPCQSYPFDSLPGHH